MSLHTIQRILCDFSAVSYYKVNETKSQVQGINVPPKLQCSHNQEFFYEWSPLIKYLDIHITQKVAQLFQINYKLCVLPLHRKPYPDGICTIARIAAFIMIVLSKLL